MTARFTKPAYVGGRIPLMSGSIMVGAVFPASGSLPWRWRLFALGDQFSHAGKEKNEADAKMALMGAWVEWMNRAGLKVNENG